MRNRPRLDGGRPTTGLSEPREGVRGTARMAALNLRAWVMASIAGASTFDPGFTGKWGFYVAAAILLTTRPWRASRTEILLYLFLGWAWASTSWALFPRTSSDALRALAVFGTLFLATRRSITSRKHLQVVAVGYLTGCLVAVSLALMQDKGEAARASIDGVNSNYLAYALAAGAAIALLWWKASRRTFRQQLVLVTYGLAMMAGVVLTGTRGALIGLGLVMAWALACRAAPRLANRILALGTVFAAFTVATGEADRWLLNLQGETRADGTLAGRLIIWPAARAVWGEHWWTGIGVGGFRQVNPFVNAPAHNLVLEAGAGVGMVGVALVLAFLWSVFIGDSRGLSAPTRGIVIGAAVCGTVASYLSGAFEYTAPSWVALALFSQAMLLAPRQEEAPLLRKATTVEMARERQEQQVQQVLKYQAERRARMLAGGGHGGDAHG